MKPSLIVSFTSYPARIHVVPQVLESLYAQSMKTDRILLWLAEEQFPNKEADLPKVLIDDAAAGKFELRWCDDLGSHKKYFYTMQEFPNDIVIIVDDDRYYHSDTIKTLYESYLRYPNAVSALGTDRILFDDEGEPLLEAIWHRFFIGIVNTPTMQLVAVGTGGVLYPPHRLDVRVFDKEAIQKLCTRFDGIVPGDDLWLKMHAALCGTPVVLASKEIKHEDIPDTQKTAIWATTPITYRCGLVNAIRKHYEKDGDDILLRCLQQAIKEPTYQETQKEIKKAIEAVPLERRLWFCAAGELKKDFLFQTRYDFDKIGQYINWHIALSNKNMVNHFMDEAHKEVIILQKMLRLTPEIQSWAECSQEVEIRAICDYGAVLRTYLWGDFRQAKYYLQMAKNWREFLAKHPCCDKKYFDGYEHFLKDMKGAIAEMEQNGATVEELDECRSILETEFKTDNYSIIIPHKDIPDLLQRCLDSIPVRDDVQVIVVDDNSDPKKVDFDHFPQWQGKRYEYYLTKEGKGAGYARNIGLDHAKGRWVVFADADDFFADGFDALLDEMVDAKEDLIFFDYINVCSDDITQQVNERMWFSNSMKSYRDGTKDEKRFRTSIPVAWIRLVKRDLIEKSHIRFSESIWSNDVVFSAQVNCMAKNFQVSSTVGYVLTQRQGSLSDDRCGTMKELKERLQEGLKGERMFAQHGLYAKGTRTSPHLRAAYMKNGSLWCLRFAIANVFNWPVAKLMFAFLYKKMVRK